MVAMRGTRDKIRDFLPLQPVKNAVFSATIRRPRARIGHTRPCMTWAYWLGGRCMAGIGIGGSSFTTWTSWVALVRLAIATFIAMRANVRWLQPRAEKLLPFRH
ncbi:hypothetical protein QBC35DRAFT_491908 [Podospora australis]|uniref:Uncharacterized protein n=1 Tax=Podospora australis TaxID=1536484 RepID=A0AAN6WX83_9PEZI|nr:hypothetical protein QBC35DRAFT_491908 [Podospora australis]